MKVDQKYFSLLSGFIVSVCMSFFMSFVMIAVNQGFMENFFWVWMRGWLIAFFVAFPTALAIVPVARRLTEKMTTNPAEDDHE